VAIDNSDGVVQVGDLEYNNSSFPPFILYPNPIYDFIQLTIANSLVQKNLQIEFYTIHGQLKKSVEIKGKNVLMIPVSD